MQYGKIKEEFINEGEPTKYPIGKESNMVFQWRKNITTQQKYLSIGKVQNYATIDDTGKAVLRDKFKGFALGEQDIEKFILTVKNMLGTKDLNNLSS